MEMPKPRAEHKKLERLTGTWKGTETMYPSEWSPNETKADGVTVSRMALGGFGVITDYEQSIGGQTVFSGHGIYTIEHETNEVLLYWFDSMGSGIETFRGRWSDDTLMLHSHSPMMGHMRLVYEFRSDGTLASSMLRSPDNATWSTVFDGVYTRSA